MDIRCIENDIIDKTLSREIKALLLDCFPYDPNFQRFLYSKEKPDCRFMVYQAARIIAHGAVHKKKLLTPEVEENIIGIADVCVAPEFRRRGIARKLLEHIEKSYPANRVFIILGNLIYYRSAGYKKVPNIYFTGNPDEPNEFTLVKIKSPFTWPTKEKVYVEGLPF